MGKPKIESKLQPFPEGEYSVEVFKKGVNESFIEGFNGGDIFFTVSLGEGVGYDTLDQDNAEILSRLVRIEGLLKKKPKATKAKPKRRAKK